MRANLPSKKGLQLNKETLRSLSPGELGCVAGATGFCQFVTFKKTGCQILETVTHIPDTGPQSMPGACGTVPGPDISIIINPAIGGG